MKNLLLGAITVGVAYLVYCQYKHSKKGKCNCAGSAAAAPVPSAGGGGAALSDTSGVMEAVPAASAMSANGDGFAKKVF